MKYLLLSLILLISITNISAQSRSNQEEQLNVGLLDQIFKYTKEPCGCSFYQSTTIDFSKPTILYVIDRSEGPDKALMKINEKVTTLNLVSTTWTPKYAKSEKKGSSYIETYRSGDVKVRVTYVVSRMYDEGALYSTTIVVTKGKLTKTLKRYAGCAC